MLPRPFHVTDGVGHLAVAVGGVDNDGIDPGVHGAATRSCVSEVTPTAAATRAAVLVFAGVWKFAEFDDVAVCDEADEFSGAIDNW